MADVWCFAVIGRDGSIIRQRNLRGVSTVEGSGVYDLDFNVSMSNAVQVASVADSGRTGTSIAVFGGVGGDEIVRVVLSQEATFQVMVLAQV